MEYDLSYHVTCKLQQESGRKLTMKRLEQSLTYAGLIEGVPNKKTNDWRIEHDLRRAARDGQIVGEPYLIPPQRRDYLREPGDMDVLREQKSHYPKELERDPEWLPLICCIGYFESIKAARDPKMDGSCLTIVWYQDDYALPINDKILQTLKQLDWDRLAFDYEW